MNNRREDAIRRIREEHKFECESLYHHLEAQDSRMMLLEKRIKDIRMFLKTGTMVFENYSKLGINSNDKFLEFVNDALTLANTPLNVKEKEPNKTSLPKLKSIYNLK